MENILASEYTCKQVWPSLPLCGILFHRPNFPEIGSVMSKACASANWYRLGWQNCCLAPVRCTGRICSVFALVRTGNYGADPGINTAKRKTEGWQWHSLQLTLLVMLVTGGKLDQWLSSSNQMPLSSALLCIWTAFISPLLLNIWCCFPVDDAVFVSLNCMHTCLVLFVYGLVKLRAMSVHKSSFLIAVYPR